MTDQSVFNEANSPQETPAPQAQDNSNLFADQLSGIKNESGQPKYDTVDKALEALAHSQDYIPTLKGELSEKDKVIQELQEKLAKTEAIEDVVSRLSAQQEPTQQETPQVSGLDEQAVLQVVQNYQAQQQIQQTSKANEATVNSALLAKFGDKAADIVASKAAELKMSTQDLQNLAQKSPDAVLSLFQVGSTAPKVTTGSISIPHITPPTQELQAPEKSLMRGSTQGQVSDYMAKIRENVYKRNNIQT